MQVTTILLHLLILVFVSCVFYMLGLWTPNIIDKHKKSQDERIAKQNSDYKKLSEKYDELYKKYDTIRDTNITGFIYAIDDNEKYKIKLNSIAKAVNCQLKKDHSGIKIDPVCFNPSQQDYDDNALGWRLRGNVFSIWLKVIIDDDQINKNLRPIQMDKLKQLIEHLDMTDKEKREAISGGQK